MTLAPDAAAGWDCRVALACVQQSFSNLLLSHGQYDRAIELYERALRIQEVTLGEMRAETAGTISSMGASYGKKGQHDRAIAETERALRICLQALDPNHPQTLQTQDSLANIKSAAAGARSGRGRR